MKNSILTRLVVAFVLAGAMPAIGFAQAGKDKPGKQQIIITRPGDEEGKTVIEIDGDKVKINGRDAADLSNVKVRVNKLKGGGAIDLGTGAPNGFNFDFDLDRSSIFSVDSNRAMLGVVTDRHEKGAEVQSVSKESAAEKAGLKKGDVITRVDNQKIVTTDDVTNAIRQHKPGEKVSITYLRDGKEQKASAELGRWKGMNMTMMNIPRVFTRDVWRNNGEEEMFERNLPRMRGAFAPDQPRLGLSVQDTDDGKGVKVLEADDDGAAYKDGVREGDIIMKVDEQSVNSAEEMAKTIKAKKTQPSVKMQVNRNGKMQQLDVRMPRKLKTIDL